jgi:hypothetical protein
LPGLFKLLAPLTILPGERCSCYAHIPGPRPLAIQWIVSLWESLSLFEILLTVFRVEEPICKVTVGECHPKKIWCMLGALQSAFREHAFLRQGGDALISRNHPWEWMFSSVNLTPCYRVPSHIYASHAPKIYSDESRPLYTTH